LIVIGSLIAGIVVVGGLLLVWELSDGLGSDHAHPARIFRHHEQELRAYAAQIRAGQLQAVSDGKGFQAYPIPQFLLDRGVTRVTWIGGRLVIQFFQGPIDAVSELWHSPDGFDPDEIERRRTSGVYFRWKELAPDWAACEWDQ
jgi:hypothetical protein